MIPDRIVIIGGGGNGSWLSFFLTQYVFYNEALRDIPIVIVDFDTFEEKNKERQFFSRPGNKAESLVGTLKARFGGEIRNLTAIAAMVVSNEDIADINQRGIQLVTPEEIIENGDLVFLCVDKCYPRIVVSRYMQKLEYGCIINGGTSLHDWAVDVFIKDEDIHTKPIEEIYPEFVDRAEKELLELKGLVEKRKPKAANCTDRMQTEAASQTLVSNLGTANLMLQVFSALLEDKCTAQTIEASTMANQKGVWSPATKAMNELLYNL